MNAGSSDVGPLMSPTTSSPPRVMLAGAEVAPAPALAGAEVEASGAVDAGAGGAVGAFDAGAVDVLCPEGSHALASARAAAI
jgi:hypothetical protein